jgi:hypothetical protein
VEGIQEGKFPEDNNLKVSKAEVTQLWDNKWKTHFVQFDVVVNKITGQYW